MTPEELKSVEPFGVFFAGLIILAIVWFMISTVAGMFTRRK